MCDDEVQITRAKLKPEIQKRKKKRQLGKLISCLEQLLCALDSTNVFYMSAEHPPALGDV